MSDPGSFSTSRLDTIVLLGAFNPLILAPHWLAQNKIITEEERAEADKDGKWLATPDVAQMEFRTFVLTADHERVQVAMTEEAETPMLIADVVGNVFRLLAHTPVRAVGLNHTTHRALDDERSAAILDRLAPVEPVRDLLPALRLERLVWAADRPDDYAGKVRLVVEPSMKVQGLYFNLNDHYDLGENGSGESVAELLADGWQGSLQRAEEIFEKVLKLQ